MMCLIHEQGDTHAALQTALQVASKNSPAVCRRIILSHRLNRPVKDDNISHTLMTMAYGPLQLLSTVSLVYLGSRE